MTGANITFSFSDYEGWIDKANLISELPLNVTGNQFNAPSFQNLPNQFYYLGSDYYTLQVSGHSTVDIVDWKVPYNTIIDFVAPPNVSIWDIGWPNVTGSNPFSSITYPKNTGGNFYAQATTVNHDISTVFLIMLQDPSLGTEDILILGVRIEVADITSNRVQAVDQLTTAPTPPPSGPRITLTFSNYLQSLSHFAPITNLPLKITPCSITASNPRDYKNLTDLESTGNTTRFLYLSTGAYRMTVNDSSWGPSDAAYRSEINVNSWILPPNAQTSFVVQGLGVITDYGWIGTQPFTNFVVGDSIPFEHFSATTTGLMASSGFVLLIYDGSLLPLYGVEYIILDPRLQIDPSCDVAQPDT